MRRRRNQKIRERIHKRVHRYYDTPIFRMPKFINQFIGFIFIILALIFIIFPLFALSLLTTGLLLLRGPKYTISKVSRVVFGMKYIKYRAKRIRNILFK